jgi:peroxiredoxin family protein
MIATGVGYRYAVMLDLLSDSMNKLYLYYANEVNAAVATTGKHVLNFMTVRAMRLVKKEVIKVYTRMLEKANDINYQQATHFLNKFIFPLGELLTDFQQSIPETKEQ